MTPAHHPQIPLSLSLRDASTFETFEAGPNGLLVAELRAVAQGAHRQAYLWGRSGSGRSHLLEAAVRQTLRQGSHACLLSAAELRFARPEVLDGLEEMALVALDDLDLLAGERHWEEALFHLYNRLSGAGGRLVIAAGVPPAEAGFGLADLSSRLAAGPVFQLLPLADEDLVALFRCRAAGRGLEVSSELARYIVTRSAREPAALVGHLARLDHAALAHQRRLTQPFVRQVLGW